MRIDDAKEAVLGPINLFDRLSMMYEQLLTLLLTVCIKNYIQWSVLVCVPLLVQFDSHLVNEMASHQMPSLRKHQHTPDIVLATSAGPVLILLHSLCLLFHFSSMA